jgi:hypothetical protein
MTVICVSADDTILLHASLAVPRYGFVNEPANMTR